MSNEYEQREFEITDLDRERILTLEVDGRVDGECGMWTVFRYPESSDSRANPPFILLTHGMPGLKPVYDYMLSPQTVCTILDQLVRKVRDIPPAHERE
jgi:hypothetical protein